MKNKLMIGIEQIFFYRKDRSDKFFYLIDVIFCQVLKNVAHVDVLLDGRPVDPHAAFTGKSLNLFAKNKIVEF